MEGAVLALCVLGASAAPAQAAVYTFSGSTTLPSLYADGPHGADIGASLGLSTTSVLAYSLTVADETPYVGADYRNYFATAFSLSADGVELIKTGDLSSDAYVSVSRFDADGTAYDADILTMDIRRSMIAGVAAEPVNLQFHLRFAGVFGAFGPDLALPTDPAFLAAARPGDPPSTNVFAYNGTGEHFDSFSLFRPDAPSTFAITQVVAPAPAPEPAAWALMILGFGFAGRALRAARRVTRAAA